jgi:ABC-type uncharacterized transport system YnjBCD substrate-binding protein
MSCASSEITRFKKNTKTMSDAELLNCYYGIRARMKDIDNGIKKEKQLNPVDPAQKRDSGFHQTYFIGGEAFGLMQKEKLLVKEMKKRNIKP